MAKTIIIRQPSWLERHPVQIRRLLVRLIFSEATQYGWEVRMAGQHWSDNAGRVRIAKSIPSISDEEWAMIMGTTAHPVAFDA